MKKVISSVTILAVLSGIILLNVNSAAKGGQDSCEVNIDSRFESFELEDATLSSITGNGLWDCVALAGLGMGLSIASLTMAAPTGGASFWLFFAAYNVAKAALIDCFFLKAGISDSESDSLIQMIVDRCRERYFYV